LFNDVIQNSDAPPELKSAALAESVDIDGVITITFPQTVSISAIGVGNTDGTKFSIYADHYQPLVTQDETNIITNDEIEIYVNYRNKFDFDFYGNGLYCLGKTVFADNIIITTDAHYIGRIAAGLGVSIGTSVAKQLGWNSSSKPRTTLSGQVITGAGGHNYRTLSLDTRYKMGPKATEELASGYKFIGLGYPFFIDLADEKYKLPHSKLYATEQNQRAFSMEGGVASFLYSKRFEFTEAF